jgi:hypothetical protein
VSLGPPPPLDLEAFAAIPDPLGERVSSDPDASPERALPGPTRRVLHRRRAFALVFAPLWLLFVQIVIGIRGDLPVPYLVAHVGVPAGLGALAIALALSAGPFGLGPTWRSVGLYAVIAPVVFVASAFVTPAKERGAELAESVVMCGDFIMAAAIIPLFLLIWAQRKTFAAGAGRRSALLGVGVGFLAGAAQVLHCAHDDGLHIAVGHSWPAVAMGLLGGLGLRYLLRVA